MEECKRVIGTSRAREWWREEVPYPHTVDTMNSVISPVFSVIPLTIWAPRGPQSLRKGLGKTQIDRYIKSCFHGELFEGMK